MLDRLDFDMLIVDIHIPSLPGLDLLTYLRKNQNKSLQQMPVLLTSHENQKNRVKDFVKAGADSFLLKPFDKKGLHEGIVKALIHRDEVKPLGL